ncbi:MAG: hypothetical protein MK171_04940 [Pirellulales bacterium]|nr:hypothetical protein [Pirellulales bacterium]
MSMSEAAANESNYELLNVAVEGRPMKSFPWFRQRAVAAYLILLSSALALPASLTQAAGGSNLQFQRPGSSTAAETKQKFRRPSVKAQQRSASREVPLDATQVTGQAVNPLRPTKSAKKKTIASKPESGDALRSQAQQPTPPDAQGVIKSDSKRSLASSERVQYDSDLSAQLPSTGLQLASHSCDGDCMCEAGCGIGDPCCGMCEPGCGLCEPGCGCTGPCVGCPEPGCCIVDATCGCADPGCGMAPSCGSCVGRPGPDYWCFPICLPRFKDLSVWGGVQGFRGPRDFIPAGQSNSGFGFHQGVQVSGRAPLLGLLFPQLSSQFGYQAVQSRLHGTLTSSEGRSQQFVTAGFFRRVQTGLQFGAVWDYMDDDLNRDVNLQQVRAEVSIKSPRGREIGFWSATSTNSSPSLGGTFATVDQFVGFFRLNFNNSYEARFWGGGTSDSEGIVGAEFFAPLNDRWSVRSTFNYLITDEPSGPAAVQQESWNVGISLVWHMGRNARRGCRSPFRPLFSVADNGSMFVGRL